VYLDTSFFDELARMGGAGDFAAAYVIGHEVGHHVQTLLGTSDQVRSLQQQANEAGANGLQVAMELQADCFAGVWAYHANQTLRVLEPGDVEEGLAAAAAIGDDRIQRNSGRAVTPESFTHGSSADRQRWLSTGLQSGDPGACNTFNQD
jgi:predicted metalloprotease